MKPTLLIVLLTFYFKPDCSQAQNTLNVTYTNTLPTCNTCCDGTSTIEAFGCVGAMLLYKYPTTWTISTTNYYEYSVKGICSGTFSLSFLANETCPTTNYVFTMPFPTIVSGLVKEQSGLRIYPNPVTDFINIKCEMINDNVYNLSIINALGQVSLKQEVEFQNGETYINTKDLPSGVYELFVQVNNTNSELTKNSSSGNLIRKRLIIAK